MPGGCWSAAYLAAPVTLSMPSRRVIGWPMLEPWRIWAGLSVSAVSGMMSGMSGNSGRFGKRRAGQRGQAVGRAGDGEGERPHDDAAGERDLEGVVAGGLGVGESGLGGTGECRGVGARAVQELLGLAGTPRLGGDAAKR